MAKYQLTDDMILNLDTKKFIPKIDGNAHYEEYKEWLAEGNTPIPPPPSLNYDLVGDEWILNTEAQKAQDLREAKIAIRDRDIMLFEMLLALWEALQSKGVIQASDLPKELRDEAVIWKEKLDLIKGA